MPQYLHYGHSSVQILPSGSLKEVRRGFDAYAKIQIPHNWSSYEEWIAFATDLTIPYSYNPSWHPDQIWLAQWFRQSTLIEHTQRVQQWGYVCERIQTLREAFMKTPTQKIGDEIRHFEHIYAKMFSESKKRYSIVNANTLPKMMIQDQYGYLHSLYMCLKSGQMAIDSADHVGQSFAELGIQPIAIYNREFGVYYRVS